MPEPSDLTRALQHLADLLRGLTPEQLTEEERANARAALVELAWLVDQTQLQE